MVRIRPPAVADSFYPGDPRTLDTMLTDFFQKAARGDHRPKGIISPHAGYIYSGEVAASAFEPFYRSKESPDTVLLLGPSHHVFFEGVALSDYDGYSTPLGVVELNRELHRHLLDLPDVQILNRAHDPEHSLEVQIPFLQKVFHNFKLLPMVVGRCAPLALETMLEFIEDKLKEKNESSLIVVSSDLSHYLDYESARERDRKTARTIESLRYEELESDGACGSYPIGGLLALARKRDYRIVAVDLRNSGDTAGPKNRVVGYGAFHMVRNDDL